MERLLKPTNPEFQISQRVEIPPHYKAGYLKEGITPKNNCKFTIGKIISLNPATAKCLKCPFKCEVI